MKDADAIESALSALSHRWAVSILLQLAEGKKRPMELLDALPMLSKKVLADRFHSLLKLGLIAREKYNEVPPRVEYSITFNGRLVLKSILNFYQKFEQTQN